MRLGLREQPLWAWGSHKEADLDSDVCAFETGCLDSEVKEVTQ